MGAVPNPAEPREKKMDEAHAFKQENPGDLTCEFCGKPYASPVHLVRESWLNDPAEPPRELSEEPIQEAEPRKTCEIRFYEDNSEEYDECSEPGERIEMPTGYPPIYLCPRHRSWAATLGKPWL